MGAPSNTSPEMANAEDLLTDSPRRSYSDRQRMAFGAVAELYDRARPGYPDDAVEEVLERARMPRRGLVLEVGAGTGKATLALARRGLRVLALEPDARMAEVLRHRCRSYPLVEVRAQRLEEHRPERTADLVLAAQSWHWVDPERGFAVAGACLRRGGLLAALWTLPRWQEVPLRAVLLSAYERHAPGLAADFPMHPGSRPQDLARGWEEGLSSCPSLRSAGTSEHPFRLSYSAREYAELICTHQDHILLESAHRDALLAAVRAAIEEAGGTLRMSYATSVCYARVTQKRSGRGTDA